MVLNSCFGIYKKAKNSLQAVIYYSRLGIIRKKEKKIVINMEEKPNKHKPVVSDDFWHFFNAKLALIFFLFVCFYKSETH